MMDDYGLEASGLDPDTTAELRRLRREQAIVDAMAKQGMTPLQGGMVGNVYVRPSITQGLANLANSYFAGERQRKIDEDYKAMGEKRKAVEKAAFDTFSKNYLGSPEKTEQLPPDVFGPPQTTPAVVPTPESKRQALLEAAMSASPRMQNAANMMFKIDESNAAKKAAMDQRMAELQMRMEDARVGREERLAAQKELMQMRLDAQREMKQMAGAISKTQPYFSPFDSSQGAMVFDHRTGKMVPAVDTSGKPIMKAASDPSLQGEIAGAKKTAQAKAERAINMAGLGDAIKEAEDLLSGASGKALPTGSGIGTAVDYVAGIVGASPEGAKEAQTLKAIGGALTSKMPRMEGPQSDKDTQLYKEMAALVGDSTVPRERRLAALQKVKELWGKYESGGVAGGRAATGKISAPPPPAGFTPIQ